VLHGAGGEDGVLQEWLEEQGARYVGSDTAASALCFDKHRFKQHHQKHNVKMPAGHMVVINDIWQSPLTKKPFVVKPHDGGSTIDAFIVRQPHKAPKTEIEAALNKYGKMLLEELIEGIELTVGVVGDTALPVIEIVPPEGAEFDYENKYNGATAELCPPKRIDKPTQRLAQDLALKIHDFSGCRDLSRTDFILTQDGELVLLETNTLPGMTDKSLLPKAARQAGYDMPQLCDLLVQFALAR
jgi:D-alanine-D-alanine ligase